MLGLSGGTNMRGLNEFISDIRACKDKQSESKRVDIQLAKIRQRFTTEKGLNAYQRKKYVWKLLYIHILGYEVQFGFHQAATLINSSKYDEKYTGYVASGILISQKNESIWKSILHSIQSDLRSRSQPAQSLAFSMIATIVPEVLVTAVTDTIIEISLSNKLSLNIRRKAILCLTRILKKYPNKYDVKKFISPISDMFEKKQLNFITSASSLLVTLLQVFNPEAFKQVQPKIVRILHRLALSPKECSADYIYFSVPNPWLQMKLYKILQLISPPEQKGILSLVQEILTKVLKKQEGHKSANKNNVEYGILFEAINVIIHYDTKIKAKLMEDLSKILVVFISSSQANIRYLGLQAMCRLAIKHDLSSHQGKILANLDDSDISIRRRALDLLYLICNEGNFEEIVKQLLGYLQQRNDPFIKDDLILKIAVLAERFAENAIWYVDVIVQLIKNAEVQNDIWYRILQIITGFGSLNTDLQFYATQKMYFAMTFPHITDTMKCVASYVISEYSQPLVQKGKDPQKIFDIINKHFQNGNNKSKAMMLNAFMKLATKYPVLKEQVEMICHMSSGHWDPDVQQRGVQFLVLLDKESALQQKIFSQNPSFTEEQQASTPIARLGKGKGVMKLQNNSKIGSVNQTKSFDEVATNQNNKANHPLSAHPCFRVAFDRLCGNTINLMNLPGKLDFKPYFKDALVKKTPFEGVEMKQKMQDGVYKIILNMSIKTSEMQFKVFRSKGFEVTHSPIKYSEDSQQIMLTFKLNGEFIEPPSVGIAWKTNDNQVVKKEIQLPIVISKFLNPVELNYEKFNTFYNDYSLANQKYFKIDSFLKMPSDRENSDYLKKVGAFLKSVCNFSCNAKPSFENIQLIYGSSSVVLKNGDKAINIPILMQVQVHEKDKAKVVRVSLRGGNGNMLGSIYQLFISFFS